MTRLGAPGADLSDQFDIHRDFLDSCRDAVPIEIPDEPVSPDLNVAGRLRCAEHLGHRVEKLVEGAAVRQRDVDGNPWCSWTIRANIRLGVENHDDRRAVVEIVPPLIATAFRTDALTVFELGYLDGSDAKYLGI